MAQCFRALQIQHDPVEFISWAKGEAERLAALPAPEQAGGLSEFESQCAQFDALPTGVKERALSIIAD